MNESKAFITPTSSVDAYVSCSISEEQDATQSDDLLKQCEHIATSENIFSLLDISLRDDGFGGNTENASVAYLAMTSRLGGQDLVSLVIQGPASAGKSYLLNSTLKYFPEEAYEAISDMSPTALSRWKKDLRNRFIICQEINGIGGPQGNPHVRTLLTENRLSRIVTEGTKNGLEVREYNVEGPVGLITTTTETKLHHEDQTRYLSITLEARRSDIRSGLDATAQRYSGSQASVRDANTLDDWIAFQRWLSSTPDEVVVPFAPELAGMIPEQAPRLNRDLPKLYSLISASARMHKLNRERDGEGRIMASLEDYKLVYPLVANILAESVDVTVPDHVRKVVKAVKHLRDTNRLAPNNRQVEAHLGEPRSTVSRWVQHACDLGYLVNQETNSGRPSSLITGYELPEEGGALLPSPEELEAAVGH